MHKKSNGDKDPLQVNSIVMVNGLPALLAKLLQTWRQILLSTTNQMEATEWEAGLTLTSSLLESLIACVTGLLINLKSCETIMSLLTFERPWLLL